MNYLIGKGGYLVNDVFLSISRTGDIILVIPKYLFPADYIDVDANGFMKIRAVTSFIRPKKILTFNTIGHIINQVLDNRGCWITYYSITFFERQQIIGNYQYHGRIFI